MIVLIFTLAYRIFSVSPAPGAANTSESSTTLHLAILGSVIAWGFIDGSIYAVLSFFEREESDRFLSKIGEVESEAEKVEIVQNEFSEVFEPITDKQHRDGLYLAILHAIKTTPVQQKGLTKDDIGATVAHVFVATVSVIPSLVPLLIIPNNLFLAIRISNIISFVVLFITGYRWGKYVGVKPIRTGMIIMAIAIMLALLAIPLGG
jgi:VIT1/CCC1 family predicted Fe2+/Mn2+ transporter